MIFTIIPPLRELQTLPKERFQSLVRDVLSNTTTGLKPLEIKVLEASSQSDVTVVSGVRVFAEDALARLSVFSQTDTNSVEDTIEKTREEFTSALNLVSASMRCKTINIERDIVPILVILADNATSPFNDKCLITPTQSGEFIDILERLTVKDARKFCDETTKILLEKNPVGSKYPDAKRIADTFLVDLAIYIFSVDQGKGAEIINDLFLGKDPIELSRRTNSKIVSAILTRKSSPTIIPLLKNLYSKRNMFQFSSILKTQIESLLEINKEKKAAELHERVKKPREKIIKSELPQQEIPKIQPAQESAASETVADSPQTHDIFDPYKDTKTTISTLQMMYVAGCIPHTRFIETKYKKLITAANELFGSFENLLKHSRIPEEVIKLCLDTSITNNQWLTDEQIERKIKWRKSHGKSLELLDAYKEDPVLVLSVASKSGDWIKRASDITGRSISNPPFIHI